MKCKYLIFTWITVFLSGSTVFYANATSLNKPNENAIAQQETKKVKGVVKDTAGEPVIGASVSVPGNTIGTATDVDGQFSLTVPTGSSLLISYVGYVSQTVEASDNVSVTLIEDTKVLDEVVVVGYGTVRKANLTGAVDQVKGTVMESRPITSVAQALQGQIANLNISVGTDGETGGGAPGAKMSINLRGVTGLNGTSTTSSAAASPLIVVDGIQSQDINAINPDDIESISVLKDAASAAIYGSSAPHGVILITTKKGRKGAVKPTVTYSNNFGWAAPINIPTMLNSVDWVMLTNETQQNTDGTDFIDPAAAQRIKDFYEGKITTTTIPTADGKEWASYDPLFGNDNNDWFKVFLKNAAFSQQHNASVSGGTDNSVYYVGLGFNQKDGLYNYGDDSFKRYSVRGNLSSNLTKWLTANFRSSFTRGVTDLPSLDDYDGGTFMHNIARLWPILPLYNPDGKLARGSIVPVLQDGGRTITTEDATMISGELVFNPIEGWNTTVNYTFNNGLVDYSRDNLAVIAYRPNGEIYDGVRGVNQVSLRRYHTINQQHTINAFTSYEKNLGGHYLKGLVGFAQESFNSHYVNTTSGTGSLYSQNAPALGLMYGNTPGVGEDKYAYASRGVFGRINYGYKEKYLVELNGRHDGTSRFLEDVRYKFYPGVSAAWVASKEDFWEPLSPYVDLFKIRGSYGSLGDISFLNSDNYSYPLYYYPFYPSLGTTSATNSNWLFNGTRDAYISNPSLINNQLTWVTTTTIDFGLDLALLNNRFSATFDWFRRASDDIVGPSEQFPAVLGSAAPKANNASIETNGFELILGWRDKIGDFSYGVRATLADSRTVIKKFPNENKAINTWYDGAVVGDIWGYETEGFYTAEEEAAGIDQDRQRAISGNRWRAGDIKYANLDDNPLITPGKGTVDDPGDRKIIGNSAPRYAYGITLDAAWKGFDISLFLQGIGKRDAWLAGNYFWGSNSHAWAHTFFTEHLDRWQPNNTDGYYPNYYFGNTKNQQVQTKYLQDASYLRFKNLQLGYSLPNNLLEKVGIAKLRVYVSGENLATFSNMPDFIDPEFAGITNTNGGEGKIYPLQRTWSFGMNLTF
jgi:TonB-linked SusC/RagA family outer membrane protein